MNAFQCNIHCSLFLSVYFRMTFAVTNLPYTPELAQKTSPEFKKASEDLTLALEAHYRTIPGQQAVTVISFA